MEKKYKNQVDTLMLQLEKYKNGLDVTVSDNKDEVKEVSAELASSKKEIH